MAKDEIMKVAFDSGGVKPPTQQGEVLSSFDFSSFGALEMQKYLYETGIQNAFNEYQKNIANLSDEKQKEIENAYVLREASKKYLGEYASNIGLGDVSGQLLNIYGEYQKNINDINQYYNQLQMGFDSAFSSKKDEYTMSFASAQYESALEGKIAEIQHNIITGNLPEGMSVKDYLTSERKTIGETAYWQEMTNQNLLEKSKAINSALYNLDSYETQEDWDAYVDSLVTKGSINSKEADQLKGSYLLEMSTRFSEVPNIFNGNDITFYNPNNTNIKEGGKVYVSANKEVVLAETNNVIDSYSNAYANIRSHIVEVGDDKIGREIIGYNVPFPVGGIYFVKRNIDGEDVFVELAISNNPLKASATSTKTQGTGNVLLEEEYQRIDKQLGGKSGVYDTGSGLVAYTYDEKTKEYSTTSDFVANNVKADKGEYIINGITYEIKKDKSIGNNTDATSVMSYTGIGKWKTKKPSNEYGTLNIMDEFLKIYFNNDKEEMASYIGKYQTRDTEWYFNNRESIDSSSAMVVKYDNNYYTINNGRVWRLTKKQ